MSNDVLVLVEQADGKIADVTFELLGKARHLADAFGGQVHALLLGETSLADQLGAADVVLAMSHPSLVNYTPEAYEKALVHAVRQRQPRLVMLGTTTAGLDLAAPLSVYWDAPVVSYVVDLAVEDGSLVASAQIYAGKLMAEVVVSADRSICTVIAGSFGADAGRKAGSPPIEELSPAPELSELATSFISLSKPEASDVDITVAEMLVSVGRGIGSQDNLEVVQELADALGVPLSASRPIIDQGWLPKPRQVGKSGLKVKPKAYLMFGISGAP
ncbi:MAG: electron transfer flavoprotein subunit alpha/FixB family protein, partial [Acidimicrobiales bacterium]